MNSNDHLEVTIKYRDYKQTVSGSPETVTKEYFNVITRVIPTFRAISNLIFEPNVAVLAEKLNGSAQVYKDKVYILEKKISLEDAILLLLSVKYVAFGLKLASSDSLSLQEIIDATGKRKQSIIRILKKLKAISGVEELLDGKFRILDWKAYDFILKKSQQDNNSKITDFVDLGEYRNPVYTIGYEGQNIDHFLKALNAEGIDVLIDVRRDAYSRQDLSYGEGALSNILTNVGIKYLHLPELGVDFNLRQELKSTHDYETYFKRYSDYLDNQTSLTSFIASFARNYTICLMCYEKSFKFCHRSILAKKLEQMGIAIRHI